MQILIASEANEGLYNIWLVQIFSGAWTNRHLPYLLTVVAPKLPTNPKNENPFLSRFTLCFSVTHQSKSLPQEEPISRSINIIIKKVVMDKFRRTAYQQQQQPGKGESNLTRTLWTWIIAIKQQVSIKMPPINRCNQVFWRNITHY